MLIGQDKRAMKLREFQEEDARFCFSLRSSIFIKMFYDYLGKDIICAVVNSYMPEDYITKAQSEFEKVFIVEIDNKRAGFFTIKKIDNNLAEIPQIYFSLEYHGKGLGKKCMQYIEDWIKHNWNSVKTIFLDTIIPDYNCEFYKKQGYKDAGEVIIYFSNLPVKAKRFEKNID